MLEKATKLFEAEYQSGSGSYYNTSIQITITPAESASKEFDLHEICDSIKKAIDQAEAKKAKK